MSTELKSRSKAYNLLRYCAGAEHGAAVHVSQTTPFGYGRGLTVADIAEMFRDPSGSQLAELQEQLDLLDETMERLRVDLAEFALTGGDTMVAY